MSTIKRLPAGAGQQGRYKTRDEDEDTTRNDRSNPGLGLLVVIITAVLTYGTAARFIWGR